MKVSRGVETSVEEGIEKNGLRQIQVSRRCRGTNHQIHEQKLDRSTRCREAIEDAETFSIDPPIVKMLSRMQKHSRSIHQVSRSCRDCDKKTLKKLDKQQGIEQVSRNNSSDPRTKARSIHQVSRSYRGGRNFLDLSTRYREAVRKAIRNSWRSSTNNKVSRRYRGGVEPAFKTSFSRCEKHRHECNPTCNSTNDPINILSSQNNLSIKILSTWILIAHTYTK